jgi:hypothetical protein
VTAPGRTDATASRGGRRPPWLFEPVPRGRVAVFRTLVYLFVAADLVWFTRWAHDHDAVSARLYHPLLVTRLLHLPTPTPTLVSVLYAALLPGALVAATGRLPRLAGWTVFALYLEWMVIAMSYGKVDHDRFGLLVALAVLPTAGPARHRDRTLTERGGWALRATQLAVVATYFLSAWAKLRFGGPQWLVGATLARAVIRRGTWLAEGLPSVPGLLVAAQFGIMALELCSPLVFVLRPRLRYLAVAGFYLFHATVFATITISFAPHLVALASFLPLERLARRWRRRGGAGPERPEQTADEPAPDPTGASPAGSAPRPGRTAVPPGGPAPRPG